MAYCAKLTGKEKAAGRLPGWYEYRLPTEAEWEYACRAGTTTRFSYGDDPDYSQLGEYAWYENNSSKTTHSVGQKKPNGWGLYDMHGNVFEWCQDWFGNYPGGSVTDPQGAATGSDRVLRGGYWDSDAGICRSAYRDAVYPGTLNDSHYLGFRPVLASSLD